MDYVDILNLFDKWFWKGIVVFTRTGEVVYNSAGTQAGRDHFDIITVERGKDWFGTHFFSPDNANHRNLNGSLNGSLYSKRDVVKMMETETKDGYGDSIFTC